MSFCKGIFRSILCWCRIPVECSLLFLSGSQSGHGRFVKEQGKIREFCCLSDDEDDSHVQKFLASLVPVTAGIICYGAPVWIHVCLHVLGSAAAVAGLLSIFHFIFTIIL